MKKSNIKPWNGRGSYHTHVRNEGRKLNVFLCRQYSSGFTLTELAEVIDRSPELVRYRIRKYVREEFPVRRGATDQEYKDIGAARQEMLDAIRDQHTVHRIARKAALKKVAIAGIYAHAPGGLIQSSGL